MRAAAHRVHLPRCINPSRLQGERDGELAAQREEGMDVEKVERKMEIDDDGRVRTGTTHRLNLPSLTPCFRVGRTNSLIRHGFLDRCLRSIGNGMLLYIREIRIVHVLCRLAEGLARRSPSAVEYLSYSVAHHTCLPS